MAVATQNPPILLGSAKMRGSRALPVSYCVGHLHDDLKTVAGYIQRLTARGVQTVWAEDDGSVHSAISEQTSELPSHWIVGTFSVGLPLTDIVDDLRALLRERSKDWIID